MFITNANKPKLEALGVRYIQMQMTNANDHMNADMNARSNINNVAESRARGLASETAASPL